MRAPDLQILKHQLLTLENNMLSAAKNHQSLLSAIAPTQLKAANNLLHYLALRKEDVRALQDCLHIAGLSSLASSESHIHRQVQSILQILGKHYAAAELDTCSYQYNQQQMVQQCEKLFGSKSDTAIPYLMVTFDAGFEKNYALIKSLLINGMNVARINCAHDDEVIWRKMIYQLKKACRLTGLECKIYMDLAGPKIRTLLLCKGKEKRKVKVKEGELFWLCYDAKGFDANDVVVSPNEPGIIAALKKGERVYIDDGIVKGIIETIKKNKVAIRIKRISSSKQQIKTGKGINFPDSVILVDSLTAFDKACLPFICTNADMVGYSFVKEAADINNLQLALKKITENPPHLIIKIETPEAVINLPDLLLSGMQQEVFGVMIARGDLAVEIGFERMGEIQEEILWICEAAHVPVIWATQVLENLNKSGIATRSEITDAAHAAMAECVMINKGDHTIKVIETLRNLLRRIGGHHNKKRFTFRPLSIAENFLNKQLPHS